MIKTHRLSDAQAAVLTGPVEYSASGHVAVTTGRENTLASLRKLGLLNGCLLTRNGNNARISAQAGNRKVTISEDGTDTFYAAPVEPTPAPADVCPNCTQTHPADDVELHAAPCFVCASDGHAGCQHADVAPEPLTGTVWGSVHGIKWTESPDTFCGEIIRTDARTLRVSVDPSDMTCPDCIAQEAELAALDNAPEPSDAECHQEAIREALDARVPDADTMYAAFVAANTSGAQTPTQCPRTSHTNPLNAPQIGLTDDARWCGVCKCWDLGLIESTDGSMYVHPDHTQGAAPSVSEWPKVTEDGRTVWACCESSIGAPCQHRTGALSVYGPMVVVEPSRTDRRKVVAWILGVNQSLRREFRADRSMPLHVAYWAQTHGVRPVSGRRFQWQQHETLSLAPARI